MQMQQFLHALFFCGNRIAARGVQVLPDRPLMRRPCRMTGAGSECIV